MPLIGALVAVAALAGAGAGGDSWAKFSAHQALSRLNIDVEIGTADRTAGEPIYWVRRTVKKFRQKAQISQVDTRSCPRMLTVIRSLHDLSMPSPFLDGDPLFVSTDGTVYSLSIRVAYPNASPGDLALTAKDDTPLAAWVEDALATLDSCIPK